MDTNDAFTGTLNFQEIMKCGPSSLFMFLVASGYSEVTYEQLEAVPISPEGTSLLNLRDAARKFGVNAEIRKYHPGELDSMPLPAIAQMLASPSTLTKFHFNVVYKIAPDRVYMLNGTTGYEEVLLRSRFNDFCSGYVMIEKRSIVSYVFSNWRLAFLAACLFVMDVVILGFWIRRQSPRVLSEVANEVKA